MLIEGNSVLTVLSLQAAITLFKNKTNKEPKRLVVAPNCKHGDVLEIIFRVCGQLSMPYEKCYALPADDWILVDDDGNVLYSNVY